jgi:hypothetical protein
MRITIVLLTLFIFLGFADVPANGAMKVRDFEQHKDAEVYKTYIDGVAAGYFWANATLEI